MTYNRLFQLYPSKLQFWQLYQTDSTTMHPWETCRAHFEFKLRLMMPYFGFKNGSELLFSDILIVKIQAMINNNDLSLNTYNVSNL